MTLSVIIAVAIAGAGSDDSSRTSREALSCIYKSRPDDEPLTRHDCAWKDHDGDMHVRSSDLRRLDYDKHGLAVVFIDRFYYVRRDGRLAPTMTIDNWADSFHNGLARSQVNGKIGYIDRRLRLRIPARYDGAYPFDHGFAVVCLRCTKKSDGEHSRYKGGVWGCIDPSGRELSPFRVQNPDEPDEVICPKGS